MSGFHSPTEIEAESRSEMVCPNCFTQGLEEYPAFARDHDDYRKQMIHGTRCPECEQRVPPDRVCQQLKPKSYGVGPISFSLDPLRKVLSSDILKYGAGMVAMFVILFWVPMAGMSAVGGGGPNVDQEATNGIGELVVETDGWQIRQTEDGYIITDGESYLCHDGVRDELGEGCSYDDLDNAENRLQVYLADGDWQIRQTLEGFTITNGESYICRDGIREEPGDGCYYEDRETAENQLEMFYDGSYWDFNATDLNISDSGELIETVDYLHGTIVDQNDDPYAGGEIIFSETGRTVEADENGEYQLDEHLDEGTYSVYARTSNASSIPFDIEVDQEGRITVLDDPESAIYVETDGGTISQNRLNFIAESEYNIGASGGVNVEVE